MNKILIASILFFIAETLIWFQNYGPLKIPWLKDNQWIIYVASIPITYLFVYGTKICYEGFDEAWPIRFVGFSVGILSFSFLTTYFYQEPITAKTIVCILLAVSIISIQLLWK